MYMTHLTTAQIVFTPSIFSERQFTLLNSDFFGGGGSPFRSQRWESQEANKKELQNNKKRRLFFINDRPKYNSFSFTYLS